MPYTIRKNRGKDTYRVKVKTTGEVLAFNTVRPESVVRAVQFSKLLREKPSAYRSMKMSEVGLAKRTPKSRRRESDLLRWKREAWQNLTAKITDGRFYACGTQGPRQKKLGLPSVCRPTKRINSKTPMPLGSAYSDAKIKKAIRKKIRGERIIWKEL
jgi:hypothetical protein